MSSFFGADTDELRDAGKKCEETAQVVDQTIMFLRALVAILLAASIWTGGSSATYAKYLQGTVIPWLQKMSMALHLMAKVLGQHAEAQDRVSAGETVDFSKLTQWQMPELPATSAREYPVMTMPQGSGINVNGGQSHVGTAPATGGVTGTAGVGGTLGGGNGAGAGSTGGALGGVGVGGALGGGSGASGSGTFSGGAGSGLGSGGSFGGGGASGSFGGAGSPSGGSGAGTFSGGAGSGLGAGSAPAGTDAGTGVGSGGTTGAYSGSSVGPGTANGGPAPIVGTAGGEGSNAGTYAAAGAAGLAGLGGAAALAGAGAQPGQGKGYTSPTGFDYTRIKGVKNNPHVTPEFLRRTEQIATKIGAKPEDLLAVMSFETGESFNPAKKNPSSSATGLIQFMSKTATGLGTSTAQLRGMTSLQQLDYVEKYFGNGKYGTLEELYSKVLAGHKISDPDKVLFRPGTEQYRVNRGLDTNPAYGNHDGQVTLREATNAVRAKVRAASN